MKNGIIKVYYGDGKGKTTAAIGQGIMAASEERSVIIIQFLKSRNREEMSFISRLEPEIKLFRFEKSDACFADLTPEQKADEKANLRNGMNFARKVLSTGECNVLILDEVLGLLDNGIITVEDLTQLQEMAGETELIFTGQKVSDEVLGIADEAYRLETVKDTVGESKVTDV